MRFFLTKKKLREIRQKARKEGYQDAFAKMEPSDKIYFGPTVIRDCKIDESKITLLGDGHMIYHNTFLNEEEFPAIEIM